MLFGPASLKRQDNYARPATNGYKWGVTKSDELPVGGIATFAVVVRYLTLRYHID